MGLACGAVCRRSTLLLACCAVLAGCAEPVAQPSLAAAAPSAEADFARFDRLVTPESVFPDPALRGLYRMLPPMTENGQRSYVLQLRAQPGMNEARHFQLITITWARGGRWVQAPGSAAALSGTGGPGGGFVSAYAQTEDRAYDVRVTLGSLLADSVKLPDFDVAATAAEMVRLYKSK